MPSSEAITVKVRSSSLCAATVKNIVPTPKLDWSQFLEILTRGEALSQPAPPCCCPGEEGSDALPDALTSRGGGEVSSAASQGCVEEMVMLRRTPLVHDQVLRNKNNAGVYYCYRVTIYYSSNYKEIGVLVLFFFCHFGNNSISGTLMLLFINLRSSIIKNKIPSHSLSSRTFYLPILVVAQIRGHTAVGSYPPSSLRFMPYCISIARENFSPFFSRRPLASDCLLGDIGILVLSFI